MNITVYLPDEIGAQAKDAGLPLSRLLRAAVERELTKLADIERIALAWPYIDPDIDLTTEQDEALKDKYEPDTAASEPPPPDPRLMSHVGRNHDSRAGSVEDCPDCSPS